jgi:hypothetical protein
VSNFLSYAWTVAERTPGDRFRHWITYPVLLVLVGTAVAQIVYLNRALQRFDSRVVVPTQFVCFTISAVIGSAVLYRDFENVDFDQLLNFRTLPPLPPHPLCFP